MKKVTMRLPFDGKTYTVCSNDGDQIVAGIESNHGLYEPHLMNLLQTIVQPHSVCLDIGANVGAISLALGYLAPYGKVYAFEPSKYNFQYLARNLHENGMHHVEPVQLGAYDQNVQLQFSYVDFGGGWSHITTYQARHGIQEMVQCVKIDDWVRDRGIEKVDLIKLDVEGAEYKAVLGAEQTIVRMKPDLVVEFNPKAHTSIFGEDPSFLYLTLAHFYPHIYLIDFDHSIVKLQDYVHLLNFYKDGREVSDLYCTFREP